MFVDPRVAHNIAREGLVHARRPFRDTLTKAREVAKVFAVQRPMDGSLRTLRRSLPKLTPKLSRILETEVWVAEPDGLPVLMFDHISVEENGVGAYSVIIDSINGSFSLKPLVRVTTHAMARLMQRCGTTNFDDVRIPVVDALSRALAIRYTVREEGWMQFGIPSTGGLFVGQLDARGTLELATWFVPGATGQASRWENYTQDLGTPNIALSSSFQASDPKGATYFASLDEWAENVSGKELSARYPFLLKLHHAHAPDKEMPLTARQWPNHPDVTRALSGACTSSVLAANS